MQNRVEVMENSGGRFFGLHTKAGVYNARFMGSSPEYVTVYDRNAKRSIKIKKSSITKVNLGGLTY